MRMREFVKQNRAEIDAHIVKVQDRPGMYGPTNDKEREEWVMNDEPLYRWAQRAGVPV